MNRRQWLYRAGLAAGAASVAGAQPKLNDVHDEKPDPQSNSRLPLEEYEPKSMLHVHESYVPRARFATIDIDRKSTRLNSSHRCISYAVFCLKKKNKNTTNTNK